MNKYLTLAAGATLLLVAAVGTAVPASAQTAPATSAASGPFQDVPADHWAYAAVNTLQKAGIVIGYPDGTYGGRRAMTRYEFAEAIARLLPQINNIDTSQFAKASDLAAFETDTNSKLQSDEDAIAALQALVAEFQPELTKLGADVDAIKRRLDSDEDRLAAVEAEQKRVKITGDINFIARDNQNFKNNRSAPLDEDGYRSGSNSNTSFWSNPNVYHDVLLTIDGRVSDTAHAIVKIDATDYSVLGSYDELTPSAGSSFGFGNNVNASAGAEAFTIFRAYIDQPVNLGFDGNADLQVGRLDEQFTPYTLKAQDVDSYVTLPEDNNGNVGIDGAKLNFSAGPVKVNAYAGKSSLVNGITNLAAVSPGNTFAGHRPGNGIDELQGGVLPEAVIDQSAGAHIGLGVAGFEVGATAVLARVDAPNFFGVGTTAPVDTYNPSRTDNTLGVYGADINGPIPGLGGLGVDAEFAISPTGSNSKFGNVNESKGNEAYNANLAYTFGPIGLKAGYEAIYNNFEAPGFWGKIGSWTNPTNVHGEVLSATYTAGPGLSFDASGNILRGLNNAGGESPLGSSDSINSVKVGVKYAFNSAYNVDLGYEYVQWDLKNHQGYLNNSGKPSEQYINIGVGHPFSANATLKLMYQIINYGDNGTGFDPAGGSAGGVAVSQLEVKF